ncbi:MAG: D-glycerate dehydrogenase [Elusimicrobia bacterium]|nr:D-glycerate dehydrogenase [Elusimicrobiota bacterium]
MGKPRVFITRRIPETALQKLQAHCRVRLYPKSTPIPRTRLQREILEAEGLLCLLTDPIDSKILEGAPKLKVIANCAVGFDNIDLAAAASRHIAVSNTPGILTETTADFTWALLLAVARRIVEADRFMRAGKYRGWDPLMFLGSDVHGKTLGILGFGRIGQAVARRAQGFSMRVLYYDPAPAGTLAPSGSPAGTQSSAEGAGTPPPFPAQRVSLEELLRESDFVSIHTPLNPQTRHLLNRERLRLMKPSAYLINTARGPIVEEKALRDALKRKEIAGAALDVYEKEPRMIPGLAARPNTILVPHIASASRQTRARMAEMAAENILAVLVRHEQPASLVT